jgi:hypothetical protein
LAEHCPASAFARDYQRAPSHCASAEDAGKMDQYTRCDEGFDPLFKVNAQLDQEHLDNYLQFVFL